MNRSIGRSMWWTRTASVAGLVACMNPPMLTGCAKPTAVQPADATALVAELKRIRPDADLGVPHGTPVPGVLGLDVGGGNVVYGTADGSHLFAGDLYAVESNLVNLTEKRREGRRAALLADVDTAGMIVFRAATGRAVLNVFTDIDCTHCRRLHSDISTLNEDGIEVRYLAYPRAGLESPSYSRMVSAWCADDPLDALTALKQGREVPDRTCANPVADHYQLAKEMGLPGTPGLITAGGATAAWVRFGGGVGGVIGPP